MGYDLMQLTDIKNNFKVINIAIFKELEDIQSYFG